MSEDTAPHGPVRIAHHADGTADVDGVPVYVEPGQDVRDAAYQAAVMHVAARTDEPVRAVCVEPDGREYPLTLYPDPAAFAAPELADRAGGSHRAGGAGRRPRRPPRSTRLSLGWLVAAACVSVLLSVLATVLLQENGPDVVNLAIDTQNSDAFASSSAYGAATTVGGTARPRGTTTATAAATGRPTASKTPVAPPSASPVAGQSPSGGPPSGGVSGGSQTPSPTPDPSPKPTTPSPKPLKVESVAVSLVGGDKSLPGVGYLITVSASGTQPISLTYTYSGGKAPAVTGHSTLSGQTEYMEVSTIPRQAYCGSTITMTASTVPAAAGGPATASAVVAC